jgi:hypothetical protein
VFAGLHTRDLPQHVQHAILLTLIPKPSKGFAILTRYPGLEANNLE